MEQFDVITATFVPQRSDDLKADARHWIGFTTKWTASWLIERGPYVGQWAMLPGVYLEGMGWVPLCDLQVFT